MEDEKLGSGGSEGANGNPAEGSEGEVRKDGQPAIDDPRFKDPAALHKSYLELEQKLGQITARQKDLEEQASLADEAAEALAAQRNITASEARALLREESRKLLEKHAPERERVKEADRYADLQLKVDKRDLLDSAPEAAAVIDAAVSMARATGKPLSEVYERHFKAVATKLKQAPMDDSRGQSSTVKNAYRDSTGDEPNEEVNQTYRKAMEAARGTRNVLKAESHMKDALKAKLFGKK